MLLLTQYIAKHELKPIERFLGLDDILDGAQKVIKGLAVPVKSPRKINGYHFFKVKIGKKNGARMIVFLVTENKKAVPVIIRLKKDKIFGMNMSMNNREVVEQMNKNLDHIMEDIKKKDYREF
jgi:hypothetical protein